LRELGPTPLHRKSFGLVRQIMADAAQPSLGLHEIQLASPSSHTTTA
jgi:ribonuclease HII